MDEILLAHSSSNNTIIQRRGRAWSGLSSGGGVVSFITGGEEVTSGGRHRGRSTTNKIMEDSEVVNLEESQKYRLPEHTNGNGTKAMSGTKQAHLERDLPPSPVEDDDPPPPPPIAKDSPLEGTMPGEFTGDASSYFNPFGLARQGSIYTLSRVSFANQLAQLTSLQLPDADSLSTKITAIPTSKVAARALTGAAEQIRSWISKASEVITGLDGEDDIEWAAAGGREGLEEVDNAISRFEELIKVYVSSIESLQSRDDIATVPADELKKVVLQVETILVEWDKVKTTLKAVKNSVEVAMEWEELWNTVLGDIGNEMDVLSRLVFEMEEKRHRSLAEATDPALDLNELETIVEETPPSKTRLQANNRFSVQAPFPMSPNTPSTAAMAQDDSSLLALFARMQPLRASLDFLPMRLSTFHFRAEDIFPTACEELEQKRGYLEDSWKKLEKDAESLRRELGEDRWVLVFRGAGRQAQKMYESVERSVSKLREAVEADVHMENPAAIGKKIESYEAKKTHYGPAIERVLSIIDKGVKDRLTVNGEILRLHSDMQKKWDNLKELMLELDVNIEDAQTDKKSQQLRDSISSMVSNDRSTLGSMVDTPGSSPASSVVISNVMGGLDHGISNKNGKVRSNSKGGPPGAGRRSVTTGTLPRQSLNSRLSTYGSSTGRASPSPASRNTATPTQNRIPRPALSSSASSLDGRPRWNGSVNTKDTLIGHNFKPLSLTTPSPHARTTPKITHTSADSKLPLRSPLSRGNTSSPSPMDSPTPRASTSRLAFRDRVSTPGPYSQEVLSRQTPTSSRPRMLGAKSSMPALSSSTPNRRASMQPSASDSAALGQSLNQRSSRPASSMASSRRQSLLPTPKGRRDSSVTGRESPQAVAAAESAMRRGSERDVKKPWR